MAVRLGSNRGLGFRVGWFKVLGIEVRKGASEFVCNNLIRRVYVYRTAYTAISLAHIEVRQHRESFRGFSNQVNPKPLHPTPMLKLRFRVRCLAFRPVLGFSGLGFRVDEVVESRSFGLIGSRL